MRKLVLNIQGAAGKFKKLKVFGAVLNNYYYYLYL